MVDRYSRRKFLSAGPAVAALAASAGCSAVGERRDSSGGRDGDRTDSDTDGREPTDSDGVTRDPIDVRGAAYIPARTFNFFQMWADYDRAVIERDLGYARRVNLNAVRTWASYEFWRRAPDAHERALDHFLQAAADRGISVLLSLFEGNGVWPTEEALTNRDPFTAVGVRSPGEDVLSDRSSWDGPREFVRWVMDRYGDDDRLLAVEAMNEPNWDATTKVFGRTMFETLARNRGRVPLTVGATSMTTNMPYLDWGIDVLQFHYNFPDSRETYRRMLRRTRVLADEWDGPTWLTEWQRVRSPPLDSCPPHDDHTYPGYATLAPLVHRSGFGNFFWSLMVKPAYLPPMRGNGVLNGLFHEDGAVWSREDARAIKAMSGDPTFEGEERQQWPEWAKRVKERACDE